MHTPENIETLKENEIFVFGSNILGEHLGGAAYKAGCDFGATMGVGEGIEGMSYAFPTLNEKYQRYPRSELNKFVKNLYDDCENNPNKIFYLTKVGCGIAGYGEQFMKSLFINSPKNLIKPKGR